MIDSSILITIIPPIFAAIIAYAIAKLKSSANERIQRAKLSAEVNHKAMEMVRSVVDSMKTELQREIQSLREENKQLKSEITRSREEIDVLRKRLSDSSEMQSAMQTQINSLKATIHWYEKRLKDAENGISGSSPP